MLRRPELSCERSAHVHPFTQPVLQPVNPDLLVWTMNHAAQVAQPVGDVVSIPKDLLPGRGTVEAKEFVHDLGAREQVSRVSRLGCFSD